MYCYTLTGVERGDASRDPAGDGWNADLARVVNYNNSIFPGKPAMQAPRRVAEYPVSACRSLMASRRAAINDCSVWVSAGRRVH